MARAGDSVHGIQLVIFVASLQGHERCIARAPPRHREGAGEGGGKGELRGWSPGGGGKEGKKQSQK